MFAGITWGQFALYVGLAVVIYYVVVILVYFRAELAGRLGKSKKSSPNLARPPATTGAPLPVSPMGVSTDYGNLFVSSPADRATPVIPPVASPLPFLPSAEPPLLNATENAAVIAGDPDDWDAGVFAGDDTADDIALVPEAGEDQAGIAAEIDLGNELISFENGQTQEVAGGGIPVENLFRTVELINQEEITPAEKQELTRQISLFEGTRLLDTLPKHKARISQLMEEAKVEQAQAGRVGERPARAAGSRRAAGKKAFADVDINKLMKTID